MWSTSVADADYFLKKASNYLVGLLISGKFVELNLSTKTGVKEERRINVYFIYLFYETVTKGVTVTFNWQ